MSTSKKTIYLNGRAVGEADFSGNAEDDAAVVHSYLEERGLYREADVRLTMLRQAISFGRIAKSIYEQHLTKTPVNPYGITPFVVNSTFSIELYLKTLAFTFGATLRGHELSKLFAALPREARALIPNVIETYVADKALKMHIDLEAILVNLNDSFREWRYFYEGTSSRPVSCFEVFVALDILHRCCERGTAPPVTF